MEHSWTELSPAVLGDNIMRVRAALTPGSEIIFVVKADAYGHGMIPVCSCAIERGVKLFAVAHVDEAVRFADRFPGIRIFILGVLRGNAVAEAAARGIVPMVVSEEHGLELAAEASSKSLVLECHVKIDTGMGRLGFLWDKAVGAIEVLSRTRGLKITGICTHLASSGDPDGSYSRTQVERFLGVIEDCLKRGITFQMRHVSNSGGFQGMPGCDYEAVRCGIELYGYGSRSAGARVNTLPFLQWKSTIAQVRTVPAGFRVGYGSTYTTSRETNLATIDIGYADGYCRLLGNKAQVLVGGRRVPVVGRVSMNLITVDLGTAANEGRGEEVVMLGRQRNESIWADEIAQWCGTIPYEVLTSIRTNASYFVDADGRRLRMQ
ncbi:MAG: alanine racemase [bacterium]